MPGVGSWLWLLPGSEPLCCSRPVSGCRGPVFCRLLPSEALPSVVLLPPSGEGCRLSGLVLCCSLSPASPLSLASLLLIPEIGVWLSRCSIVSCSLSAVVAAVYRLVGVLVPVVEVVLLGKIVAVGLGCSVVVAVGAGQVVHVSGLVVPVVLVRTAGSVPVVSVVLPLGRLGQVSCWDPTVDSLIVGCMVSLLALVRVVPLEIGRLLVFSVVSHSLGLVVLRSFVSVPVLVCMVAPMRSPARLPSSCPPVVDSCLLQPWGCGSSLVSGVGIPGPAFLLFRPSVSA